MKAEYVLNQTEREKRFLKITTSDTATKEGKGTYEKTDREGQGQGQGQFIQHSR